MVLLWDARLSSYRLVLSSQKMKKRNNESSEGSPIPITVRQLEAIVRISESIARMQL
jgi:DNA replication licensing factor MCM5